MLFSFLIILLITHNQTNLIPQQIAIIQFTFLTNKINTILHFCLRMFIQQRTILYSMQSQNFSIYLSKLVQVLMHLRIDVKKQQTDHFQRLLTKKKKTEPLCSSLKQFFDFVIAHNLYDIATKALKQPQKIVTIKVVFSFVCKQTQVSRMAETWYFHFQQTEVSPQIKEGLVLNEVENSFQEFISLLVKLPLWERFWGNSEKRKEIKKKYNLSYRIEYNKPSNNNILSYDKRVEKELFLSGISVYIVCQYVSDFCQIINCSKQNIEKTIIIKDKEQISRKKSLYEFYDQQFDITFVSSDSQITNNTNKQMKIVGTIDEESDDEYQIIIDEDVDRETQMFKRSLKQVTEEIDIVMEKYF